MVQANTGQSGQRERYADVAGILGEEAAVTNHNDMGSKMRGRGNSKYQMRAEDGLTADQRRATEEYERTGKIPRLVNEGREPWGSASDLLRYAGYLRFRKIYGGFDFELLS